ncbi:MAG: SHOCT domain-containing protein [Coriobacteriia bacterium]|nr:SHOCT domain-containing protein [Coriobacteriia bacterium]
MMGGYRGLDWGYGMMGGGAWSGLLMLLFGALVIAGIVLLVIWAVRAGAKHGGTGTGSPPPPSAGHDDAIAIARRRLAGGEITPEQYEEIVTALGR